MKMFAVKNARRQSVLCGPGGIFKTERADLRVLQNAFTGSGRRERPEALAESVRCESCEPAPFAGSVSHKKCVSAPFAESDWIAWHEPEPFAGSVR